MSSLLKFSKSTLVRLFCKQATVVAVSLVGGCGTALDSTSVVTRASQAVTTQSARSVGVPGGRATSVGGLSIAASAVLTIDLSHLANYAAPALPAYYDTAVAALDNSPSTNPVTDAGATLGRVLFYDRQLSLNGTISCSSCHQQALGFSDASRFSIGFTGTAFGTAHTPRLENARYYQPGSMFWDKRVASIEAQASVPIQNTIEMGFDAAHGGINATIATMNALPYYPELFRFAFGDATITQARMQAALAQYERSMIATTSRWDAGYATSFRGNAPNRNLDVDLPNFTVTENRGRHLFMAPPPAGGVNCASCHVPPTFALDPASQSNGLDAGATTVFKSPSLKDVSHGPYMHDGRFASLDEVVAFYDHGVQAGPSLDRRLQQAGSPQRLRLSAGDQAAIVAFLRTLDDATLSSDARFVSPFKR